jgi:hypothetical protein
MTFNKHGSFGSWETLDPNSPEYCIAAGRIGLERLLEDPFRPFVIICFDLIADISAPWIAFTVLNPRAITLQEFGSSYKIGLSPNQEEGVKQIYGSIEIKKILDLQEVSIPSASQDVWCVCSQVNHEEED